MTLNQTFSSSVVALVAIVETVFQIVSSGRSLLFPCALISDAQMSLPALNVEVRPHEPSILTHTHTLRDHRSDNGFAVYSYQQSIPYLIVSWRLTSLCTFSAIQPQMTRSSIGYHHRLPNMLVNRLVLNLRQFGHAELGHPTSETEELPSIAFEHNRVLGNIGEPLDPGQWDLEHDRDGFEEDGCGGTMDTDMERAGKGPQLSNETAVSVVRIQLNFILGLVIDLTCYLLGIRWISRCRYPDGTDRKDGRGGDMMPITFSFPPSNVFFNPLSRLYSMEPRVPIVSMNWERNFSS